MDRLNPQLIQFIKKVNDMKSLFTSIFFLFFIATSFAQGNSLTIFSEDGHPFYLILNGIRQNENPETNVRVDNLDQDYYASKIIFASGEIPEISRKFLNVSSPDCKPCAVAYKIKTDKKGQIVMKPFSSSSIFTPPPPSVAVVQYNTKPMPAPVLGMNVQVSETTTTTTSNGGGDNVNVGVNVGGFNMGVNVNVDDGWNDTHTTTTTTTTTTVAPSNVVVVEEVGCNTMSASTLQGLLSSMDNQSFDDEKLTIAKQATASNCLTSNQIKQVMNRFGWEDSKLEYAKFAYGYCLDQNNYWQVNDAFEWDDSIEELNNSIGR